ncbi:EAL domain-containing protein [Rhizobium sp. MHM7A]|uniref:putative bifunctional diguanylate cyclase/phosphodiesterase n=1 Tax=Rhizobium sp. MHM7A TaxID=2583233 RepID=UPI001106C2B5|nr:EAL domain-containing protein [Rhizobium sp. MHM7A]TLX16426.1 EAL domain-containing protein [Rhizobium sp. MHM7A]
MVRSLYEHKQVLVAGCLIHLLSLGVAWVSTSFDTAYVIAAAVIVLIFLARQKDMSIFTERFHERTTDDIVIIREWENRYIIGSMAVSLALTSITSYSFWQTPHSTASTICLALQFGSLLSVVGRNFGSQRNVRFLTVINGFPPCIAYVATGFYTGEYTLAAAGLLLIPSVLVTDSFSSFIRGMLVASIRQEKEAASANARLEAAIANMPNGMIMLDQNNYIVEMNGTAIKAIGLPETLNRERMHVDELLKMVGQMAGHTKEELASISETIYSLLNGSKTTVEIDAKSGRCIRFTAHVINPSTDRRSNRDAQFTGAVVLCEDVTEQRFALQTNWRQARYDALSHLPNRRYMHELMQEAADNLGEDRLIAFCQFDVDGFKTINDTQGHDAGDEVIEKVAAKMLELQREDDRIILTRLGGDEFVVAYRNLLPHEDVAALYNHVFSSICTTYEIKGKPTKLRCSGGVALTDAANFSLDELMRKSDYVLYRVKHNPKRAPNHFWGLFSGELENEFMLQIDVRDALKQAIYNDNLTVVFQPIFKTPDKAISYCEALVRWTDPVLGEVSPKELIKVAEELGLVQAITRHVLNIACAECSSWNSDVGVAVNFSTHDLYQSDCLDMIEEALAKTGLDPSRLHIEIHENAVIKNLSHVKSVLEQIANMGVNIAVDDFGSGYQVLNYVRQLPLSKVKIDRSFISSLQPDEKMRQPLHALVALSAGMNAEVVVEGVETDAQLNAVMRDQQIDHIQGYHLGYPMDREQIREKIALFASARQGEVVLFEKRPKPDLSKAPASAQ